MHRRTFLATGGLALAGLAGCVASDDPAGGGDGGTQRPAADRSPSSVPSSIGPTTVTPRTGTATPPTNFGSVDAVVEAVQPAVVYRTSPDSIGVLDDLEGGDQFVFLSIDATAPTPPRSALGLRFDGSTHSPVSHSPGGLALWRFREASSYSASTQAGWILFAIPHSGDASAVALTWPDGEWPLPDAARSRVSAPAPSLSVSFDAREELPPGTDPAPTVTVTNRGSVVGRFVGALNRIGPRTAHAPIAGVAFDVPAGESVTRTIEDSFYGPPTPGDDDPDARYIFRWRGGKVVQQISILAS